jgi:hypothetical protein
MPPGQGGERARGVSNDIPRIARRPAYQVWARPLEESGPADQMRADFGHAGRSVMPAQPQPAMGEQKRRQRAGNEQRVIEPIMEKGRGDMRPHHPSIQHIQRACAQKKRIAQIEEPLHNNARIRTPNPIAKAAFAKMIKPTLKNISKSSAQSARTASSLRQVIDVAFSATVSRG